MNERSKQYWESYWKSQNQQPPTAVSAWQFGADPDYLAQLVINGEKTATCSGHLFYELENEPLPAVGHYSVILSSTDEPLAIITTVEVTVTPMNEVSEEFAVSEGEGDKTYEYWWKAHEQFFTEELSKVGLPFSEDMLLVCERFKLVNVK